MVKEILTTHDISRQCHVDISTVANWVDDGSLKAYKTKGGHRRIKRADLVDFLKKHHMPFNLKQKIVIIDDEESIREGLKETLENNGCEVEVASDGLLGAMLVERFRPQVVILDLVMPLFDGFYFCEVIKKQMQLKDIKIIVLTGYSSRENIEKAKKAGANKVLAKPMDNKTLVKEVKKML